MPVTPPMCTAIEYEEMSIMVFVVMYPVIFTVEFALLLVLAYQKYKMNKVNKNMALFFPCIVCFGSTLALQLLFILHNLPSMLYAIYTVYSRYIDKLRDIICEICTDFNRIG